MSDLSAPGPTAGPVSGPRLSHAGAGARRRLYRRYRTERLFRGLGIAAVLLAMAMLALLLSTIVGKGLPAFTYHHADLDLDLSAARIDAQDVRAGDYRGIVRDAIDAALPFAQGRAQRRIARGLVSQSAEILLREAVADDAGLIGGRHRFALPVSDTADLYLKGLVTTRTVESASVLATPTGTAGTVDVLANGNAFAPIVADLKATLARHAGDIAREIDGLEQSMIRREARIAEMEAQADAAVGLLAERIGRDITGARAELDTIAARRERLGAEQAEIEGRIEGVGDMSPMDPQSASYFVAINGGIVRITHVSAATVRGDVLLPLQSDAAAAPGTWTIERIAEPETARKISDREIAYLDRLVADGLIESRFNRIFFTRGASREPEFAGILGALVGSFLTLLVTLALAFPLGVAAAIYLQEFAPTNRWTRLVEVSINNLAAVPSIVFGLLGLAVFLNFFGLPRSAPLVGGMVLALMTLPTIIIASRAALTAVPPSIREAALAVGASRLQAVFHHVLPLAMPGILTGTIIGMAQALGETAPLLMIGMVAFIVEVPGGLLDPATVLPVQIFMWADLPEQAFAQKTAAAILVLLVFLLAMNAAAVLLRRRFERRW